MDSSNTKFSPGRSLSTLNLVDSFNMYLSFPETDINSFYNELCSIKNDSHYVNIKTIFRWRMGESRPRKNTISPEDMRRIFCAALSKAYSNREHLMLSFIIHSLECEPFEFDVTEIKSACDADPRATLSTVVDLFSFTVLGSEAEPLQPLIKQLHSIAIGNSPSVVPLPFGDASQYKDVNSDNNKHHTGSAVIKFTPPLTPFDVEYYVRHIKNGKDEFLSGNNLMPINKNIKFEPSDNMSRSMHAVINDVPLDIGFQFKCFAKCDPKNVDQLQRLLSAHIDYSHARFKTEDQKTHYSKHYDENLDLIAASFAEDGTVWFILPNYVAYVTFDPFINNYFLPEFKD